MNTIVEDRFIAELPADPETSNQRRQVMEAAFSYVAPKTPAHPQLIHVSDEMMAELGFTDTDVRSEEFLQYMSGAKLMAGSQPYAMCYGGHQFGHWAGQLGDGRAINLGAVLHDDQSWMLQLKGAGPTPYSRTADGLAVLRSSVREHLCSEAIYHLGVATTRSLSLALTGDQVLRDVLYDGNAAYEKGAIVCRVAPSFIRFGNFQIFASRSDVKNLQLLADHTIKSFYPEIKLTGPAAYVELFRAVSDRTRQMIVDWQRVGFVHGVMNTDNMSILGLTIDYGPYGWLEAYDPQWTPNTTDKEHRRYRYGNQPAIAQWNLFQLANALFPIVNDAKPLEEILNQFQARYLEDELNMMRAKLGLVEVKEEDAPLVKKLEDALHSSETDMTIFYRQLCAVRADHTSTEVLDLLAPAFYRPAEIASVIKDSWIEWIQAYLDRLRAENQSDEQRAVQMRRVNPKYVLRNYMAQLAIDEADKGDYRLIDELYQLLKRPYDEQVESEKWYALRPEWARNKVGCSMLSCSS